MRAVLVISSGRAGPAWLRMLLFCMLACATVGTARAEMFGPIAGHVVSRGTGPLVLVAHGDSSPDYLADFARDLARDNPGATVIHLARPGYSVRDGGRSKGSNNGKRDHYTRRNNQLLAEGISAAKAKFPHTRTIAIGHSGGSNQLGVVIGRAPGLIDTAILLSGSFYINRWRSIRGGAWPKSESAPDFLASVPRSTRIIVATGAADSNTVPSLGRDYAEAARARGLDATFISIPGANHGFKNLHGPALKIANREIRH